jgi:hypothetical protein
MESADAERFAGALKEYGHLCNDVMEAQRLMVYWKVLSASCTIDEFVTVCNRLMAQEREHRVPMPAVFLHRLELLRQEQSHARMTAQGREREARRRAEECERESAMSDPEEEAARIGAMRYALEKLNGILGANWRTLGDLVIAGEQRTSVRQQTIRKIP